MGREMKRCSANACEDEVSRRFAGAEAHHNI